MSDRDTAEQIVPNLDAYRDVDGGTLSGMFMSDLRDPDSIARAMWAFARNEGAYFQGTEEALVSFIWLSLDRVRNTLYAIHESYQPIENPFDPDLLLRETIYQWLEGDTAEDAAAEEIHEIDWPWPITEPVDDSSGGGVLFENKWSGMYLCGYRVGKTNGMPDRERVRFLDHFFRNPLPEMVSEYHGDSYGEPGSEQRLQKMAQTIAANCVNFKKNDRHKYRYAIADYESDLDHLKRAYYKAGMFPWPQIDR